MTDNKTPADRLGDCLQEFIHYNTKLLSPYWLEQLNNELSDYHASKVGDDGKEFPANDWFPCKVNLASNWGPWLRHDGSGSFGRGPKHVRVSLGSTGISDAIIYLGKERSGWGRNYSPDWSDIRFYRMRMDHPHYLGLSEQALETLLPETMPPQSVGDDELVERLKFRREWCVKKRGTSEVRYPSGEFVFMEIELACLDLIAADFDAAITRLQSQSADPWVKIEDIPEEWKDGRPLDLIYKYINAEPVRIPNCKYLDDGDVWDPNRKRRLIRKRITHAMLHIALPQETKTD